MQTEKLTIKGSQTRERIVAAAAELMLEFGAHETTLDEIKSASRVSSSQLYHYFDDKQAIVRAVIDYQTTAIVAPQEVLLRDLSTVDGLRGWRDFVVQMQHELDFKGGCPIGALGSEFAEVDLQIREDVLTSFVRWELAIARGLANMQRLGRLPASANPQHLALALLTALQGGLLLCKVQRATTAMEVALDAVIAHIDTLSASTATANAR
jgi:TetR/AcrR family transcriptional repressor of nem operon